MENNIVEEKKSKKSVIICVMSITIIVLLAVLVYFVFIKKDDPSDPIKPQDNTQVNAGEVKQLTLDETNKEVTVGNKKMNLKVADSTLYINDVEQTNVMFEGNIFITDKYILIAQVGQNGYGIDYAIDANGKVIDVYKSVVTYAPYSQYQVTNIRSESGKIIADYFHESCTMNPENTKDCESKVEFVYDGNNVVMSDMSLDTSTQALTRILLSDTNKLVKFNGNYVKLRSEPDKIYFNDKLVKDFGEGYGNFGVYVSKNMMFIFWVGMQCDAVFIGAINQNGEFVNVENPEFIPVYGVYEKNNVVTGTGFECPKDPDYDIFNVKFSYNGNKVTLVKEK